MHIDGIEENIKCR